MKANVIGEYGADQALYGNGLSFGLTSEVDFRDFVKAKELYPKMYDRACKLAHRQGGHNKFLEHIQVWLVVDAPLYWWKQMDTYRHLSRLSESTMHTVMKKELLATDFEKSSVDSYILNKLNEAIRAYKNTNLTDEEKMRLFKYVNDNLPQSFLQKREINLSYKTLQNIINQRQGHKLEEWTTFILSLKSQIRYPEFLFKEKENG